MKWKPQTLHHTTTNDVKYLGVSATQNFSSNLYNPKEIASTPSSKASGGQREYISNMPSKSMPVDLAHVIKNNDHASTREEDERQQHCDVSKGDTIKDNIGLLCIDDRVGDDMVSACLVKKMGFEIENNTMPYHINMICQDKSKQRPTDRFLLKVPNGMKNTDEEKGGVIATCMPLSVREAVEISSGLLLFRRREMMTVYVEKHFLNLPKSECAILMSKNIESNPLIFTALSVGQVQELINELPKSEEILQTQFIMKDMQHIINQVPVTMLADFLYASFTSEENRNLPEHVDLLPSEGTTEGVVRKSESICARPASAIPKKSRKLDDIIFMSKDNCQKGCQETCMLKESEWKTSFKPITEFCEFLVMSTKRSNHPKILWIDQTRTLYRNLKRYYGMTEMPPSIQELLTLTIPSSSIEKLPHHKISQNKFQIVFQILSKDMAGMKLINEEVNMCALLLIIMEKQNCSWRMYMDGQDIKCYIHCQDCIVGLFCRLLKYSKMSLYSPYHQIIFNHRGEHNKRLHPLARIHEQLVFAIGLHIDWENYYTMGESIAIPHVIMHANDIIADKENIAAIHDLLMLANLHQDQNYQGLGWFHIPFIKSCSSVWTLFIDCTGIGKLRWAEKLRIKKKLCTALELVQKDIMEPFLLVRLEPSHSKQRSITTYNIYVAGIFVLLTYSILFTLIYLTENEENSRTSSFEEGAPDVGQNVTHEPIFYYYGQVLIGGPLNAYWAKGASLRPDTFVRKSPWDHKYL